MIRALIIDDEEHARLTLAEKLKAYCPEVRLVGMADSAEAAYQQIVAAPPDLLFLDVAMPRESGFDLLKRLPSLDFEIIFVTGFDRYALDAISFCAIGYVLKPIQTELLINAVHQARQRIEEKKENQRNRQLLANLTQPGHSTNRIGIPTSDGLEFVATRDIIRCEGLQKCTRIIIDGRQALISSYNIGEFIRLLEPYGFFSVHKSHLINMAHIRKYNKEGTINMEDGSSVPVSKRRRSAFLDQLTRL